MATSDDVIDELIEGVAALGADKQFRESFREAMYALTRVAIAEHISAVEKAEGQLRH
jgi:hypothetical protein